MTVSCPFLKFQNFPWDNERHQHNLSNKKISPKWREELEWETRSPSSCICEEILMFRILPVGWFLGLPCCCAYWKQCRFCRTTCTRNGRCSTDCCTACRSSGLNCLYKMGNSRMKLERLLHVATTTWRTFLFSELIYGMSKYKHKHKIYIPRIFGSDRLLDDSRKTTANTEIKVTIRPLVFLLRKVVKPFGSVLSVSWIGNSETSCQDTHYSLNWTNFHYVFSTPQKAC